MTIRTYTEYFCLQCQQLIGELGDHFTEYPDHVVTTVTTTSGVVSGIGYNVSGHADEIVAPIGGTSTLVVSGFDTIEEALNYLVSSGVNGGMPTTDISGYVTLDGAVQDLLHHLPETFVQVDFCSGTDLLLDHDELALYANSTISGGYGDISFTVDKSSIKVNSPTSETFEVTWSVAGLISGSTASPRRRNLVCDLKYNENYIPATIGGDYNRDPLSSSYCQVTGSYFVQTGKGGNERIAIRSRDFSHYSTQGIGFTLAGGYLRLRLVKRSIV